MAFDETLAVRVREIIGSERNVTERKMFGGLAFMVRRHMCCGILGKDLMLRIGEGYEAALTLPHVRPMDFTGRPMWGIIYVGSAGIKTRVALKSWLDKAAAHARSLPSKRPRKAPPPKPKRSYTWRR